jgi:hypothetical protein
VTTQLRVLLKERSEIDAEDPHHLLNVILLFGRQDLVAHGALDVGRERPGLLLGELLGRKTRLGRES